MFFSYLSYMFQPILVISGSVACFVSYCTVLVSVYVDVVKDKSQKYKKLKIELI
jgi:hypothetical protein